MKEYLLQPMYCTIPLNPRVSICWYFIFTLFILIKTLLALSPITTPSHTHTRQDKP